MINPPCRDCGTAIADTRAVGQFAPGGPIGYTARYLGAPLRASREEAAKDMCKWRQK